MIAEPRGWGRALALLLPPLLMAAAKPPKIPADAPYCALPGARQIFVAPMGEAFRADAGQAYPAAQWFARADTNQDGAVDRAEYLADAAAFFARIDLDHDGRLTPEEVAAYERDVAPEIALYAARREPDRRRRGEGAARDVGESLGVFSARPESADYAGPMGAGRYAWLNIPQPVASADADIDRLVSRAEFLAAANRRFDVLDMAGAGRLQLATMPRTPQQIAISGPCRTRPTPRRDPRDDPFEEGEPPR